MSILKFRKKRHSAVKDSSTMIETTNKRGKKVWKVRIQIGGHQSTSTFNNKVEAIEFDTKMKEMIAQRGRDYKKGNIEYITLRSLFDKMKNSEMSKGRIGLSTALGYSDIFKRFLSTHQAKFTDELEDHEWQKIVKDSSKKHGDCGFNAKKLLIIIKKMQKYADQNNILKIKMDVDIPTPTRRRLKGKESYTSEEYEKIAAFINKEEELSSDEWVALNFWILGMNSGLRVGELIALQHGRDINYEKKSINITEAYSCTTNLIGKPKTDESLRSINLYEIGMQAVQNLKKISIINETIFLVSAKKEKPGESRENVKQLMINNIKKICIRLGIEYLSSHKAMRKTHATLFMKFALNASLAWDEAGKALQKRLGHKDFSTTLNAYIRPEGTEAAELTIMAGFGNKSPPSLMDLSDFKNKSKEELEVLIELMLKKKAN